MTIAAALFFRLVAYDVVNQSLIDSLAG